MIVPIREYGGKASSAYSPSNVCSPAEQEKVTLDDHTMGGATLKAP
jgi:hypothetical protein